MVVSMTSLAAAQPSIHLVPPIPGSNYSQVRAISLDGTTVVGSSSNQLGQEAIRWTQATGTQRLGALAGHLLSDGYGVSGDGSVSAGVSINYAAPYLHRAFQRTSGGSIQELPSLPGSSTGSAYARALSADGTVAVGASMQPGNYHATMWSGGTVIDMGVLPTGVFSSALAVSGNGLVAVGYADTATPSSDAFVWTQSEGMRTLGQIPGMGAASSRATAVSYDGAVIAGSYWNRAFRWTEAGGMEGLGTLAPNLGSWGLGISADGSVVVGGSVQEGLGGPGWMWTRSTGMVDLNTYLPTLGVNLSGWVLDESVGVSADLTTLAGTGYYQGAVRGWVVSGLPPLPSPSVAVALCTFAMVSAQRRRR